MSANISGSGRHLHSVPNPETDTRPVIVIDSNTANRDINNGPTPLYVAKSASKPWYKKRESIALAGAVAALAGILVVRSIVSRDDRSPEQSPPAIEIPAVTYMVHEGDTIDGIADQFTDTPAQQNRLRDEMVIRNGGPRIDPGDNVVVTPGTEVTPR